MQMGLPGGHDLHLKDCPARWGRGPGDGSCCPPLHIPFLQSPTVLGEPLAPNKRVCEEFPLGQGMSSGQTGLVKVAKVPVEAYRTYPPQVGTTVHHWVPLAHR